MPGHVVREMRDELEAFAQSTHDGAQWNEFRRRQFVKMDRALDGAKSGPRYLADARIARLVIAGFRWLTDRHGWDVKAATVMSNHVHCLLRNLKGENHLLAKHLGVLKGFTAREANKILGRDGSFWLDENFDHWCRNPEKIESARRYIHDNPVKAGLVSRPEDWPWRI